ncbi:MAG: hypothetical protein JWL84_6040 [Rhodospirillales bacterium]|nr:hypothetical protein [Rhodospirillales bacterium]
MADAKDDDTAAVKPRRKKSKGAKLGRGSGWAPVIVATLEKYGPGTLEWLRFHMNARGRVAELESSSPPHSPNSSSSLPSSSRCTMR